MLQNRGTRIEGMSVMSKLLYKLLCKDGLQLELSALILWKYQKAIAYAKQFHHLDLCNNRFDEVFCSQCKIKTLLQCDNLQASVSIELSGNTALLRPTISRRDE